MEANEYQRLAMRTAAGGHLNITEHHLINAALGLTGESGEIADHIKKFLIHGHTLDRDHLVKEAGDIMWYLALLATTLGTTLGEVMRRNIHKLEKRYPNGFSSEDSKNRLE